MSFNDLEFAINTEPRCPVVLLLDTSYSMSGKPIQELNAGVTLFKQDVESDMQACKRIEVAVLTFGSQPQLVHDFSTLDNFIPMLLVADGATAMGSAIHQALDLVEARVATYKNNQIAYYKPWLLLITDGCPTDEWQSAAQRVQQARTQNFNFYTVAVKGADMSVLKQIAPSDTPPMQLDGVKFQELFKWLSGSLQQVSISNPGAPNQLQLQSTNTWAASL